MRKDRVGGDKADQERTGENKTGHDCHFQHMTYDRTRNDIIEQNWTAWKNRKELALEGKAKNNIAGQDRVQDSERQKSTGQNKTIVDKKTR